MRQEQFKFRDKSFESSTKFSKYQHCVESEVNFLFLLEFMSSLPIISLFKYENTSRNTYFKMTVLTLYHNFKSFVPPGTCQSNHINIIFTKTQYYIKINCFGHDIFASELINKFYWRTSIHSWQMKWYILSHIDSISGKYENYWNFPLK